jgi:SAM-dependent methyltransferase
MRFSDPTVLRDNAYREPALLEDRASIYQWQEPRVDLRATAIELLDHVADGTLIADLGCGPGNYLQRLTQARPARTYLGLDLSIGMARKVQPRHAIVGSLAALPLADAVLDGALAMHVLYHLADPTVALAELRRVLRPGARLVVSSNDDRANGLWQLFVEAGLDWTAVSEHWPLYTAESALEQAGFENVQSRIFDYRLRLPGAHPALRYLDSCRPTMPEVDPELWQDARQRVAAAAEDDFVGAGRTGIVTATVPRLRGPGALTSSRRRS